MSRLPTSAERERDSGTRLPAVPLQWDMCTLICPLKNGSVGIKVLKISPHVLAMPLTQCAEGKRAFIAHLPPDQTHMKKLGGTLLSHSSCQLWYVFSACVVCPDSNVRTNHRAPSRQVSKLVVQGMRLFLSAHVKVDTVGNGILV